MWKNNLTAAFRNISRQKIYAGINIAGLALSLTAVWLIALFVADEWSYDRFHQNGERIFRLVSHGRWGEDKFDITGTSGLAADALKKDFPEVEAAVRINVEGGGVIDAGSQKLKDDGIFFADPAFFTVFSYHFLAGDAHALEEPNTIVLTKSLATKLFPNYRSALHQTINIDQSACKVTGVIEDVPLHSHMRFNAIRSYPAALEADWNNMSVYTYLLLNQPADAKKLSDRLPEFVNRYLGANARNMQYSLELQPLRDIHLYSHLSYELGENRDVKYLYVMVAVGLLILLVACINYINITSARASVRLREVAVRKIMGSDRHQLVSLFLTESILTVLTAAVLAMGLVSLLLPAFNELAGKELSIWYFGLLPTLFYGISFSLLTGIIGGLYPALFLSGFRTIPALKNQLGNVKGQLMFRQSLVLFQFAVTVVMITISLVIYLQLHYMRKADLGFNKNQVLSFHLDSRELRQKVPALRAALLQHPQIRAVASAGNPIGNNNIGMMDYSVEKNGVLDEHTNLAYGLVIDPDFIPAMELKLLEGRNFSPDIASDSTAVLVNQAFLRKQGWTTGVGKRISRGKDATGTIQYASIIGVVKDFHIYSLQHLIDPLIMELPRRASDRDNIYVRLDALQLPQALAMVAQVFKSFDASNPFEYHFLDQNFANQYQAEEKQGRVLLAFTLLTIWIACMGLFGLITFTVSLRVREVGIRKVLGASVPGLVSLLTKSLLRVVCISLLFAIPVSGILAHRWLQDFAYRISLQWWIFAAAAVAALLIAMATVSIQAVKAAIENPIKCLRTE